VASRLIATTVVRGSRQGESHGGAYVIDLENQAVRQALDRNTTEIDWQGHGGDRGLRGIAIHDQTVFVAASDELFAYSPDFRLLGSWRNPWLRHCHEITVWQDNLFLTSTAYDSILAFDIGQQRFHWALHVDMEGFNFRAAVYDPNGEDGPMMLDKLHLNNVVPTQGGMYLSGLRTGGVLLFNGQHVRMAVTLPGGSHNAQPFRDGVLFNDCQSDSVRYVGRGERNEDRSLPVPRYDPSELTHGDLDDSRVARQGFARGLCVLSERVVAGGSSPATVTLYDLAENRQLRSVRLTTDVRNAIHGLEPWPFD
jgi:hypothetical protein